MPLYEFQCRTCGHRFETFQFSSTRSLPACPTCEGHDLEKLYSVFGVGSSSSAGGGARSSAPVSLGGG